MNTNRNDLQLVFMLPISVPAPVSVSEPSVCSISFFFAAVFSASCNFVHSSLC